MFGGGKAIKNIVFFQTNRLHFFTQKHKRLLSNDMERFHFWFYPLLLGMEIGLFNQEQAIEIFGYVKMPVSILVTLRLRLSVMSYDVVGPNW